MKTQEELEHEADRQKRADEINAGLDDVTRHSGDGGEGLSDFYRSLESRDEGAHERDRQPQGPVVRQVLPSLDACDTLCESLSKLAPQRSASVSHPADQYSSRTIVRCTLTAPLEGAVNGLHLTAQPTQSPRQGEA